MIRQSATFWQKLLIGYWAMVPLLFFGYVALTATKLNSSWGDLITQLPGFSVCLLISCLMLMQAVVFLQTKAELRGRFLLLAVVQQVLTLNIVGAILAYITLKKQYMLGHFASKKEKYAFYGYWGVILLLSVLITFLLWKMRQMNR